MYINRRIVYIKNLESKIRKLNNTIADKVKEQSF